jgi:hypothetical protein
MKKNEPVIAASARRYHTKKGQLAEVFALDPPGVDWAAKAYGRIWDPAHTKETGWKGRVSSHPGRWRARAWFFPSGKSGVDDTPHADDIDFNQPLQAEETIEVMSKDAPKFSIDNPLVRGDCKVFETVGGDKATIYATEGDKSYGKIELNGTSSPAVAWWWNINGAIGACSAGKVTLTQYDLKRPWCERPPVIYLSKSALNEIAKEGRSQVTVWASPDRSLLPANAVVSYVLAPTQND